MTDFGKRYVTPENILSNLIISCFYKSIIQGSWTVSLNTAQIFNLYTYNDSKAINDEIEYNIFAEAGDKTFSFYCVTTPTSGIASIYLDDILQGTVDLYDSGTTFIVLKTVSMTVIGTKMHSIKFKAASKNGSASYYHMYLTACDLK